jgi:hypothetical protein
MGNVTIYLKFCNIKGQVDIAIMLFISLSPSSCQDNTFKYARTALFQTLYQHTNINIVQCRPAARQ